MGSGCRSRMASGLSVILGLLAKQNSIAGILKAMRLVHSSEEWLFFQKAEESSSSGDQQPRIVLADWPREQRAKRLLSICEHVDETPELPGFSQIFG